MGAAKVDALSPLHAVEDDIAEVRDRLNAEVEVLQERLPTLASTAKRIAIIAVAGTAGVTVVWLVARGMWRRSHPARATRQLVALVPLDPDGQLPLGRKLELIAS
jgi:hypothetical protein